MSDLLINCNGCCDCMPCPVSIHIPEVFRIYNALPEQGLAATQAAHAALSPNAFDCIRCARCEKLCKNRISISSMMFEIQEELE